MSINHEAPWKSIPGLSQKQLNTTTWGAVANSTTIVDGNIHLNSVVLAYVTGSTPAVGNWSYTVTLGQVVITSTDSESSTLPISYIVL